MLIKKPLLKLLSLALVLFLASSVFAETPRIQLEETMEGVMSIARTFRSAADFENNKERMKQIILPRFDFAEMARRSLGTHWAGLNGQEKDFVAAFVQFAETSYLNTVGSYRGEKMTYGRERIERNFAEVETQVIGSGSATPITYKLHLVGRDWKVYDVVIDQVSLVSNFQSQFGRFLKTRSMDDLMRRLRGQAQS